LGINRFYSIFINPFIIEITRIIILLIQGSIEENTERVRDAPLSQPCKPLVNSESILICEGDNPPK